MKNNFLLFILLILFGCNAQPEVVNFSDKNIRDSFNIDELDSAYVNLLSTVENEQHGDSLFNLWVSFHDDLKARVKAKNFDWGIKDSSVIVWDRVYCDKDGNIEYYLYNIIDSTVPAERKEAYGELMKSVAADLKYPVHLDKDYAQCGSYRQYVY